MGIPLLGEKIIYDKRAVLADALEFSPKVFDGRPKAKLTAFVSVEPLVELTDNGGVPTVVGVTYYPPTPKGFSEQQIGESKRVALASLYPEGCVLFYQEFFRSLLDDPEVLIVHVRVGHNALIGQAVEFGVGKPV